jgi:Cellulase (glycosyl hydrolase family 5)
MPATPLTPCRLAGVPAALAVFGLILTGCGSSASSTSSPTAPSPPVAAIGTPLGVHVVHPVAAIPYLAESTGAAVLLRGADDNALVQYADNYPEAPSIDQSDFSEMAALGFNFIRLPVSWSRIMPQPGEIDQHYLDRVAQVVGWAKANGIGVLVDMHEDNYSLETDPGHEADGAPAWAIVDNGTACTSTISTTGCALAAFKSFWADVPVAGKPLQDWYLRAMAAVARAAGATSDNSNIVGVELMNEPWPSGPSPFEQQSLYPFYNKMISGLRAANVQVPLWFEPSVIRNLTNSAVTSATRFSSDQNLVYAVHIYTGVFSPPFNPTTSQPVMATSYANAANEAAVFGVPFVVDEYGSSATPEWNSWLTAQLTNQNAHSVGSSFWLWKQRNGKWDNWATVHLDGSLRSTTLRAQLLSQPHVDSVPGSLVTTVSSTDQLSVTTAGDGGTATLWGGTVVTTGGPTTTRRTLRQVTINGKPAATHCRTVHFTTSNVALSGCLLTVPVPAGRQVLVATP